MKIKSTPENVRAAAEQAISMIREKKWAEPDPKKVSAYSSFSDYDEPTGWQKEPTGDKKQGSVEKENIGGKSRGPRGTEKTRPAAAGQGKPKRYQGKRSRDVGHQDWFRQGKVPENRWRQSIWRIQNDAKKYDAAVVLDKEAAKLYEELHQNPESPGKEATIDKAVAGKETVQDEKKQGKPAKTEPASKKASPKPEKDNWERTEIPGRQKSSSPTMDFVTKLSRFSAPRKKPARPSRKKTRKKGSPRLSSRP